MKEEFYVLWQPYGVMKRAKKEEYFKGSQGGIKLSCVPEPTG